MNLGSGSFTSCDKHPSQVFTGFCSVCLAEKLSSVSGSPKISRRFAGEEVGSVRSSSDLSRKGEDCARRKTLSSLFKLDDDGKRIDCAKVESFRRSPTSIGRGDRKMEISEARCEMVSGDFAHGHQLESGQTGINFDRGSWVSESRHETEIKTSSSCSTTMEDSSVDSCVAKKPELGEDENSKQNAVSSFSGSIVSSKTLKSRMANVFRKNSSSFLSRSRSCGFDDKRSELKMKVRSSCDWNLDKASTKDLWYDPRLSWDGAATMTRACICTFACFEDPERESWKYLSETDCQSSSTPQERKKSLSEEDVVDHKPSVTPTDGVLTVGKQSKTNKALGDRFLEESRRDIVFPSITKILSQQWSKMWKWSINSPFRDSGQRMQHGLQQSISESWRERHQMKITGPTKSDSSSRPNSTLNRSSTCGNVDAQSTRLDLQRTNRDYSFSRSRNLIYSSPAHMENGLLRFYLTPLRSSRRTPNRGRPRASHSHSHGRGIFGFH